MTWGLQSAGFSCSAAGGNFPHQESNQCLLHWQADSYPLYHQESPRVIVNQKDLKTENKLSFLHNTFFCLKINKVERLGRKNEGGESLWLIALCCIAVPHGERVGPKGTPQTSLLRELMLLFSGTTGTVGLDFQFRLAESDQEVHSSFLVSEPGLLFHNI